MTPVHWPAHGDRTTFRRRGIALTTLGLSIIASALASVAFARPDRLLAAIPLAVAAFALHTLWVHASARSSARRREVERSFGGMVVTHRGAAFNVANRPVLGEHPSRRLAARAAIDRGGWAVIVQAWDRFYVLACEPAEAAHDRVQAAFSFRSRAVADVVPGVDDHVAMSA